MTELFATESREYYDYVLIEIQLAEVQKKRDIGTIPFYNLFEFRILIVCQHIKVLCLLFHSL